MTIHHPEIHLPTPKNTTVDSTGTTDISENVINILKLLSETGDNNDDADDKITMNNYKFSIDLHINPIK